MAIGKSQMNMPAITKHSIDILASCALILSLLAQPTPVRAAGIIYVDANLGSDSGGEAIIGNGGSWPSAYANLQDAFARAQAGDEIWVANGTYKPGGVGGARISTFQLKNGVAVYGGFASGESTRNERNPATNLTILSGDLDGNDSGVVSTTNLTRGENAYHVVTSAEGATLDGFSITAGNANSGSGSSNRGGGMYLQSGGLIMANTTFRDNSAGQGAGMYVSLGNPVLTKVTFSGNSAIDGAGMYNQGGSPVLNYVTFSDNTANHYGGGVVIDIGSPSLTNVTFSGNKAGSGAGVIIIDGNPILHNITFSNNKASVSGGGVYVFTGSPSLTNVTFSGNSAINGAGMYIIDSSMTLTNTTFANNMISNPDSGIIVIDLGTLQVRNSILWGNSGVDFSGAGIINITNSIVKGGYTGSGNLNIDPLLGQPGSYGGSTQTFPLLPGSPAIDGTSTNCPDNDQRGVVRGTTCDIGAFESQGFKLELNTGDWQSAALNTAYSQPLGVVVTSIDPLEPVSGGEVVFTPPPNSIASVQLSPHMDANGNVALFGPSTISIKADGTASDIATANAISGMFTVSANARGASSPIFFNLINKGESAGTIVYVNASASGANNGSSWLDAYKQLQGGLLTAETGQEIWAAQGIYKPGSMRTSTFQLKNGVAVYGGFAGIESARDERNPAVNEAILSGDLAGDDSGAISAANLTRDDNSYHVVTSADGATLDGFTITAGNANGGSGFPDTGGGVFLESGSLDLTNITFSENSAVNGGGMFVSLGNPALLNVTFSGNSAGYGGGIYSSNGNLDLTNVTFSGNLADWRGGGIYVLYGKMDLTNSTFGGNQSADGSGIFVGNGDLFVRNSIFRDAIDVYDLNLFNHSPIIANSFVKSGDCYSNNVTCTGVIAADLLLGPLGSYGGSTQTFPLLPGSPAINRTSASCPAKDQRGVARGTTCDIGAFESGGFTLSKTGGDDQSTTVGTAFADALTMSIAAQTAGEPVDGGVITFTAPASSASSSPDINKASIASGAASQSLTANATAGTYTVSAGAAGAESLSYHLSNSTTATVTTDAATGVTSSGATLNGTVNAGNDAATVTFEYGLTTAYGTSVVATPATATGMSGTAASAALTGLTPNSTYHYRVVGVNSAGTTNGLDKTFTTIKVAPTATTDAATDVTGTGATLNGTVNAGNDAATVTFEYGPTAVYGTSVAAMPGTVTGMSGTVVSAALTGLTPNSTYHYRVVGVNSVGTSDGDDETFTTGKVAPTATTNAATDVTGSGATLNGTVNARNDAATVTFEYGLTDSYGTSVAATPSKVTGTSETVVSTALTGLTINTTYHYRVVAVNSAGTTEGLDETFTTTSVTIISEIHDAKHKLILSAAIGDSLHASATVTGNAVSTPTGTLRFTTFDNTSCSGSGLSAGTVTLDGSGQAHPSTIQTLSVNGRAFKVRYNGDAIYSAAEGECTAISNSPYPTVLVLASSTVPADGTELKVGPTQLLVQFNQDMWHNSTADPHAVQNPQNYLLVEAGRNQVFDTLACGPVGAGGVKPDDRVVKVDSVSYDAVTFKATLKINGGQKLHNGSYRLFICGTTSISDASDQVFLNNHLKDSLISFSVVPAASSGKRKLPKTGFAPGVVSSLPERPADVLYSESGMWLEIRKLGVQLPVVGVPQQTGWDVTWLGNQAGYLEGTTFPTWNGNSVITGHVTGADGQPGAFAGLSGLAWGDEVVIHAWGQRYIFAVRSVDDTVNPEDTRLLDQHEVLPWITLLTCRGYDEQSDSYRWRTAVRAVLVSVLNEDSR